MNLGRPTHIVIIACLIGLTIMTIHVKTGSDKIISLLIVPVAMLMLASKLNKKELEEINKEKKELDD